MANLYILRGVIGSGKSTWARNKAKEGGTLIVSPDSFRQMLYGRYLYYKWMDEFITDTCRYVARKLLEKGFNVIIDCCNMTWKGRIEEWLNADSGHHHRIVLVTFPLREEEWHVNNRMKNNHGEYTREHWESVYDTMINQMEDLDWDWDEIIEVGAFEDEE